MLSGNSVKTLCVLYDEYQMLKEKYVGPAEINLSNYDAGRFKTSQIIMASFAGF